MRIEFLGTAGAVPIPRPLCQCSVCVEAKEKGIPYSRTGPGLFIHGPNLLLDTSEHSYEQLNRSNITTIDGVCYSHWHPDHVQGLRVLESMNADWLHFPPNHQTTDVYLPEQVAKDFQHRLGIHEHLQYFSDEGFIRLHLPQDGDTFELNGSTILPFRLAEDYVYGFLLEEENKRVLIVPDELYQWTPPKSLQGIDVAILPLGICEFHPLNGERLIQKDHPLLQSEATFAYTLQVVKQLQPKRTIITHIEEPDGLSYNDFKVLEKKLREDEYNIEFAYDTMKIDV
ncbi:MBL fold metallo-hydrolase [Salirhabdus salicampi]|uniref:MBL fold metallo-hydrolase n=1 Tax=Salirhabdus salicampi TaxID=476102 RepID=UPI0020C4D2CC|nr:MBL fold metallo-hydrolase [Salirhabdus salicampi]MCP8615979.1 MBL fold metallo-hydrolase [Salirhabdus salicampi]